MNFKNDIQKRCFSFSIEILTLSEKLHKKQTNWLLLDQLIRSGTSIGANLIEGGNSTSRKEFIHYVQISLKSASETVYWLELLKEINQDNKSIQLLANECNELKKILSTIILHTRKNSEL
jgi:four helix bundle protein